MRTQVYETYYQYVRYNFVAEPNISYMEKQILSFNEVPFALSEILLRLERIESKQISSQQPPEETDPIYPMGQAMAFVNLSRPSMYLKVSEGKINALKTGKKLYFLKSELVKYLMSGKRKTTDEKHAETIDFLQTRKGAKV